MIVNFEQITANLPPTSIHKYALCLSEKLKSHYGVGNELNNAAMKKHLADNGYILTPAQVRQTLHYMRVHFMFANEEMNMCYICANQKGYFITNSQDEINRYKTSLQQRMNSINEILACL